jgi:hypothetical protein
MDPQRHPKRAAPLARWVVLAVVGLFFVTMCLAVDMFTLGVSVRPNVARAAGDEVTRADLDVIQRQVNEFRGELAAYGVRITAVEEALNELKSSQTGPVTAQKPGDYWTVITLKMQAVEGRGLMQVMGPYPSAALCNATLKGILGGLQQNGIVSESSGCRTNITIVVPK